MKKTVSTLIAITLIIACLLTLASCGTTSNGKPVPDGYRKYTITGFTFCIPKTYRKLTVQYSQNVYYSDDKSRPVYFYFDCYSENYLVEELEMPTDVESYTRRFIAINDGYKFSEYEYDETIDRSVIRHIEKTYDELYYHVIFKAQGHIYIVTMSCNSEHISECEPLFNYWMEFFEY